MEYSLIISTNQGSRYLYITKDKSTIEAYRGKISLREIIRNNRDKDYFIFQLTWNNQIYRYTFIKGEKPVIQRGLFIR